MPHIKNKFLLKTSTCLLLLISFILIINSCKKDLKGNDDANLTAPVMQAKTWYENAFPSNADGKFSTQAVTKNGKVDFSKLIAPDWAHAVTYNRLNKDVVEIPLPATSKFATGLKDSLTGRVIYNKGYTRTSFLLLKDAKGYKAYVMTIMADADYINNDFSKLARNTYRKRDDDFSGIVLYFTPDGKLVNGWRYRHGKLITSKTSQANNQSIQNTGGDRLKTNTDEIKAWKCTNYYLVTWDGNGNVISVVYLYSDCEPVFGAPVGGGDDNGGNNVPPPDPCETVNGGNPTPGGLNSTHQLKVNTAPNPIDPGDGGDGGFPPPSTTDPTVCQAPETAIITDSIDAKYICAKAVLAKIPNLTDSLSSLINKTFGANGLYNITFKDKPASQLKDPKEDGDCIGFNISINQDVLSKASGEYILATMYHETLHAFLNTEFASLGQDGFNAKYPDINVVATPYIDGMLKYKYMFKETNQVTRVSSDPQHRTMADYFLDELAASILSYNPQFPADRAMALAKYGIFADTSIGYANDSERDTTKGNSEGTKCP